MIRFGDNGASFSAEVMVRFPTDHESDVPLTVLSGCILTFRDSTDESNVISLQYEKVALDSHTGTLYVTSSAGRLELGPTPVFDGRVYNLSMVRDRDEGIFTLRAMNCEYGEVTFSTSSFALSGSSGYPI